MLAMHMGNELLTPGVALGFAVLAAVALAWASRRTRQQFEPDKVPLMGVLGAFVFAAQMINFPILLGTSGHLGGGVLLAILLGPHAATLVMASILIIQCLVFQDGGLLALGANIFNLGILPCYFGYALFQAIAGSRPRPGRLYLAVFIATFVGMLSGAAMVPVQVTLSGQAAVPFVHFLLVIVGIHLLVALGEAMITFLVVGYVAQVRPQTLGRVADQLASARAGLSRRALLVSLAVVTVGLGGVVSHFASDWQDALESKTTGDASLVAANDDPTVSRVTDLQEKAAPLPDYQWTSLSGILGSAGTLAVVYLIGIALKRRQVRPISENAPA